MTRQLHKLTGCITERYRMFSGIKKLLNAPKTDVLKKGIMISGAVVRSLIGIGATALAFLALKKKKPKNK